MVIEDSLPRLVASRLVLRPPRPEDAPDIQRLVNDPGVARMTTGIPHPYPNGMAESFIDRRSEAWGADAAVFTLELEGEGAVGLLGFDRGQAGAVEAGYWLGRPYWGRGLMTEALLAALAWAGGAWGKRYLLAGHFADNPASGQVLIKSGFLYTGEVLSRFSVARGEHVATRMMVWLA